MKRGYLSLFSYKTKKGDITKFNSRNLPLLPTPKPSYPYFPTGGVKRHLTGGPAAGPGVAAACLSTPAADALQERAGLRPVETHPSRLVSS